MLFEIGLRSTSLSLRIFLVQSSGKYLGWFLGADGVQNSFKEPLEKVVQRVHEVTEGNAPAASSIIRFNQRVAPVLSYVSQFSPPPIDKNIPELSQWSIHKILRLPSNCKSRS